MKASACAASSVFRGINAAASLKHIGVGFDQRAFQAVFRGINAAASLKRLPYLGSEFLAELSSAASTPRPH